MIPSMEPPIESMQSVPIPFDESDPEKMQMLSLLKEMYVGKEHPFLTSSRDGFTYLIIPRTIQRVFHDSKSVTDKETSALRSEA